jgi:imidazolonepropionase-like amidohydrolase
VKCIEHGHLMDEARPSAREAGHLAEHQPFPEEWPTRFRPARGSGRKFAECLAGMETAYRLARKHKIKTAWGTHVLFSPALAPSPGELLRQAGNAGTPAAKRSIMATGTNAELLALSGKRNPYPGKLGVVEEGAPGRSSAGRRRSLENLN